MKAIKKKKNVFKLRFVLLVCFFEDGIFLTASHQFLLKYRMCEAALQCVYSCDLQMASLIKTLVQSNHNHNVL